VVVVVIKLNPFFIKLTGVKMQPDHQIYVENISRYVDLVIKDPPRRRIPRKSAGCWINDSNKKLLSLMTDTERDMTGILTNYFRMKLVVLVEQGKISHSFYIGFTAEIDNWMIKQVYDRCRQGDSKTLAQVEDAIGEWIAWQCGISKNELLALEIAKNPII
jgi:hypothetical protein